MLLSISSVHPRILLLFMDRRSYSIAKLFRNKFNIQQYFQIVFLFIVRHIIIEKKGEKMNVLIQVHIIPLVRIQPEEGLAGLIIYLKDWMRENFKSGSVKRIMAVSGQNNPKEGWL